MLPDLPETYYLDNVLTLFAQLRRVYSDILDADTLEFLDQFDALGEDARLLCIRLLNRTPECYRRSKLHYAEIGELDSAIGELEANDFIRLNGDIEKTTLLSLYTLAELRALLREFPALEDSARLRRGELEALLLESAGDDFFSRLAAQDDYLQLRRQDDYLLCQMLFFGNLNQSMTDFVLRDLGLNPYESYPIDSQHRAYRSPLEIEQHWLLYQLQALFDMTDASDAEALLELEQLIPGDIDNNAPGYRKSEHLRYEIARQLERLGELKAAQRLYRRCCLPPSRERRARIHAARDKPEKAIALCERIIAEPMDEQELQFACQFSLRLGKRHDLAPPAGAEQLRITHRPPIVDLELAYSDSVERAVADYYGNDGTCHYVENSLFNGVLGLLIWDVVFAPLPGAFYNPFQYRPSDFYAHDFCQRRRDLLEQVWSEIDDNDDIWRLVSTRWREKQGLMNPLVNWPGLDLDLIQCALERIDHAHWRAVFERILKDLRNHRAGFPDLIHFPADGGYCLIEVKGPGDSLQQNQQRWMQFFDSRAIPHRLARVSWCPN